MKLRIHHFLPSSYANGPGCRAVLWVQGCPLHCPGCFNPYTHAFNQGQWVTVDELESRILALGPGVEGVTISGGEPLVQAPALAELLRRLKARTTLSVIVFTGYTWAEAQSLLSHPPHRPLDFPAAAAKQPVDEITSTLSEPDPTTNQSVLQYVDVLIAGRYIQSLRLANGLRGSANKTMHFLTNRYSLHDIESVPAAEVIICPDGTVVASGIEAVNVEAGQRSVYYKRQP